MRQQSAFAYRLCDIWHEDYFQLPLSPEYLAARRGKGSRPTRPTHFINSANLLLSSVAKSSSDFQITLQRLHQSGTRPKLTLCLRKSLTSTCWSSKQLPSLGVKLKSTTLFQPTKEAIVENRCPRRWLVVLCPLTPRQKRNTEVCASHQLHP